MAAENIQRSTGTVDTRRGWTDYLLESLGNLHACSGSGCHLTTQGGPEVARQG